MKGKKVWLTVFMVLLVALSLAFAGCADKVNRSSKKPNKTESESASDYEDGWIDN